MKSYIFEAIIERAGSQLEEDIFAEPLAAGRALSSLTFDVNPLFYREPLRCVMAKILKIYLVFLLLCVVTQ